MAGIIRHAQHYAYIAVSMRQKDENIGTGGAGIVVVDVAREEA